MIFVQRRVSHLVLQQYFLMNLAIDIHITQTDCAYLSWWMIGRLASVYMMSCLCQWICDSAAKFTKHLMTILWQFYDILHTYANVLIHKTSYDNFMTKILRSLFRCLMTFQIIRFQRHPTRKILLYWFIIPLIQLYIVLVI